MKIRKMLRVASVAALACVSTSAHAIIYHYGSINKSALTCTIEGWSGSEPTSGKLTLPSTYTDEKGQPYRVIAIEDNALNGLKTVTQITIPASIKRIGQAAFGKGTAIHDAGERVYNFNDCPALEKFVVDSDNGIFQSTGGGLLYSKGLTQLLRVPAKVAATDGKLKLSAKTVAISEDAMRDNTTVATLEIPVTAIVYGNGGFNRATSLKSFTLSGSGDRLKVSNNMLQCKDSEGAYELVSFPPALEVDEVGLPGNCVVIRDEAFYGATYLKTFKFNLAESVGKRAFSRSGLTSAAIPYSVKYLGEATFENCADLTEITCKMDGFECPLIPEHFAANCRNLQKFDAWKPVYEFATGAFKNCTSLEEVRFDPETRFTGDSIFFNTGLKTVTFDSGENTDALPGKLIFANCRNLESIDASKVIRSFENPFLITSDYAKGCLNLKSLSLPQFAEIVRPEGDTNPPFGYSCQIDTIRSHTFAGIAGHPVFAYSTTNGKQRYNPQVFVAITGSEDWESWYPDYHQWEMGEAFTAGNGATVAPDIFIDAAEPPAGYVVPKATYYIAPHCSSNYSAAAAAGCDVKEMFRLTIRCPRGQNLHYQVDSIPGIPYTPRNILLKVPNHSGYYIADYGEECIMSDDHSTITDLTLVYNVAGMSFETHIGDPHAFAVETGVEELFGENEPEISVSGKIMHASDAVGYHLLTLSGLPVTYGYGDEADFSDVPAGLYLLQITGRDRTRTLKLSL